MYGSERGKNVCGKTSAAATPYRKKSYHSIEVPTADATTARTSWRRWSAALSDGPDEAADKAENHRSACDRFTMVPPVRSVILALVVFLAGAQPAGLPPVSWTCPMHP